MIHIFVPRFIEDWNDFMAGNELGGVLGFNWGVKEALPAAWD